jgi:alpha-beta hydrolase superfamily lysophospholipase
MRLLTNITKRLLVLALGLAALGAPAKAEVVFQDSTAIGKELNLPVYKWSDSSVPQKGLIFAIHGATLYAKRFDTVARHFAENGYPVYAVDMRGFGRWRTEGNSFADGDTKIHYSRSENDIVSVLLKIREEQPNQKIYCLGESLGANVAIWVGAEYPELTDGLVLSSPCIKACVNYNARLAFDAARSVLKPERAVKLTPYIKYTLCDDQKTTDEYLQDPGICHSFSAVDVIKSMKTNTLSVLSKERIPADMPVLVVAGKIDKIYKASAIPAFVAEMGSRKRTVEIIPNRGHLLLESTYVKPEVVGIIDRWLQNPTQTADYPTTPSTVSAGKSNTTVSTID